MCRDQFPALWRFVTAGDTDPGAVRLRVTPEQQGSNYEAGVALIDGQLWRVRTARITPTKPGAFVAVWRRAESGDTEPFPETDTVMGLLVFVDDGPMSGVFRFSQAHLARLGVTSGPVRAGKRGFRVYPEWCAGLNPTAMKAQADQASAWTSLA